MITVGEAGSLAHRGAAHSCRLSISPPEAAISATRSIAAFAEASADCLPLIAGYRSFAKAAHFFRNEFTASSVSWWPR